MQDETKKDFPDFQHWSSQTSSDAKSELAQGLEEMKEELVDLEEAIEIQKVQRQATERRRQHDKADAALRVIWQQQEEYRQKQRSKQEKEAHVAAVVKAHFPELF